MLLVTLTSGATLIIEQISREELASALYEIIDRRKVTHTDIPPSLLKLLAPDRCPNCLQTIVIGGEPADIETVKRWSKKVRLINVYGPTEATVCTSMCRCDAEWKMPLLGKVLDYTTYKVYADGKLDADDGELWISGIGLAIGYYKNEELTRKKFPIVDGVRYYRTSDHVRVVDDGDLMFVGRIDRQVKFHGQLIELEEIEKTLLGNRNVGRAVVVKRRINENNDKDAIIAFIRPIDCHIETAELERQLRQSCRHHLPKWMMPSFFEFVDQMPLTPTGKTDIRELETRPLSQALEDRKYAYSSKEEEAIAHAMADILKVVAVAPDDDFWQLGGDSLDSLLLMAMLQKHGICFSPTQLRQASTPRKLTRLHRQNLSMRIHSSELESEWQLTLPTGDVKAKTEDAGTILITGVTGFLGSHLVSELLTRNMSRIKCLVRCTSPEAGMRRVKDSFLRYGLDTNLLAKVEILCGDISLQGLGLPLDVYERLGKEVACVYHCAAIVNMMAGYEELKDTNVEGTRNIIDFCLTGRRKRLHYASTLSVFVSTDNNHGVVYEHDRLDTPTNIYGGYGQTKYVAEKMAIQLADTHLCDVFIYRFGLLCGDTLIGISAPKDFLSMFFRGAKMMGALPHDLSDAMTVDISPIDSATCMMVDIATTGRPGIYHIASENPLLYNDLCDLLKEAVDQERSEIPVSATTIREDLYGNWQFLSPVVQRDFRKTICIYGPESTGKSTLTKQLADYYHAPFVEEYAKEVIDNKHGDICFEDMETIVRGHHQNILKALRQNAPLLFVDTDAIISKLWSNELFGKESPVIEEVITQQHFDYYLLLDVDLPWVNDVHRYRPDERESFFNRCEEQLIRRNKKYSIIRGLQGSRFKRATECIDSLTRIAVV